MNSLLKFLLLISISLMLFSCKRERVISISEACCDNPVVFNNGSCYLSVPNIITPNDDKLNDVLKLHYDPACPITNFELKVTNIKVGTVYLNTNNPKFEWGPEIPSSGFAVYNLSMKCNYGGKSIDINHSITIYDQHTYIYNSIDLKCCSNCAFPDMFTDGEAEPTVTTQESPFCD